MEISIKHYDELSTDEFHDIIALRIAVFVVEQDCPYLEIDGLDKDAYHLQAVFEGKLVGTLRILKEDVVYRERAIGRVASHPDYRHLKLGHTMMKSAMDFMRNEFGTTPIRISAQTHLVPFYSKHGFASTGKEYLEDGIPHTEMLYQPAT